jgi:hypothetical protein
MDASVMLTDSSSIRPKRKRSSKKKNVKPGIKLLSSAQLGLDPSPFPNACKCGHKIEFREYISPNIKTPRNSGCKVPPISKSLNPGNFNNHRSNQ